MPRTQSQKTSATTGRAKGQTQISISLPKELVDRIDLLASMENRNRSNFIVSELSRISESKISGKLGSDV